MSIVVVKHELIDMTKHGIATSCNVHSFHVKVSNIKNIAKDLIIQTSNKSWITPLEIGLKQSYEARANPTIDKLVEGIFKKIKTAINSEFGEYLISYSAQQTLKSKLKHKLIPLAELWKEKSKGNPGFDFHTETSLSHISFGEAKYNSNSNPHTDAIQQIAGFIADSKDEMDYVHLKNFVSKKAYTNATQKKKAYAAAFSMFSSTGKYDDILSYPFTLAEIHEILKHEELFIIGIEIC